MEKREYYIMDYAELDEIVNAELLQKTCGNTVDFNSVAMWEWSNNESHTVEDVSKNPKSYLYSENDEKEIEKFVSTEEWRPHEFGLHTLLIYMCKQGLIPAGNYIINVYW